MALFTKKQTGPEGDLATKLEALRPEHDEGLAKARKAEAESLQRFEQAQADLATLRTKREDAESALSAARLKLAEGVGSKADLNAAKDAAEEARDRFEGQEALVRAFGVKCADLREAVRQAEASAAKRTRERLLTLAADNCARRNVLFTQLEPLTADAGLLSPALEAACPTEAATSGGRVYSTYRSGWNSSWPVLLGALDAHNSAARVQSTFAHDPHDSAGGPLARWRWLARECGFLPPSHEDEVRRERETQKRTEAAADGRLRDEATKAHLKTVWRAGDAEDRR